MWFIERFEYNDAEYYINLKLILHNQYNQNVNKKSCNQVI